MKLIIIVNLFIVLKTVTIAHDSTVSSYNEKLANDLNKVYQQYNNDTRYRQDEYFLKYRRKLPPCCAEKVFQQLNEKVRNLKEECFKQIGNGTLEFRAFNNKEQRRKYFSCFIQCVGQKENMLDNDGNPSEDGFGKFVNEIMAKENWFTNIQNQVITICINEARKFLATRDLKNSAECNPAGMKLGYCLFREIQIGCPSEEIKDEKECSRFRAHRDNGSRQENHL